MAQRTRETLIAEREAYRETLAVQNNPVPKATLTDDVNFEVMLDIRECLQVIVTLLGGSV